MATGGCGALAGVVLTAVVTTFSMAGAFVELITSFLVVPPSSSGVDDLANGARSSTGMLLGASS